MRAALTWNAGEAFEVRDGVEHREPGSGEVLVAIRATGVCASDLSLAAGAFGQPMPVVLGHEAAGEILAAGPWVTSVAPGDHIVVCWSPPCGQCARCRSGAEHLCSRRRSSQDKGCPPVPGLRLDGKHITAGMGMATFAEETVLPERAVVRVDKDVPFEVAAFFGCAVPTGAGAALRSARVQPGDSVVVFGCGAVGLNAILGAIVAGAGVVVAVDPLEQRRQTARSLGASDAVSPADLPDALAATEGGFDVGINAIGAPATIRTTWESVRRGGTVTVVGAGRPEEFVSFSAYELFHDDKRLTGSFYGGIDLHRDLPMLVSLWRTGRLPVDRLLSGKADLEQINDVVAAQRGGAVVRTMLVP